jgi:hypothetical protein
LDIYWSAVAHPMAPALYVGALSVIGALTACCVKKPAAQ